MCVSSQLVHCAHAAQAASLRVCFSEESCEPRVSATLSYPASLFVPLYSKDVLSIHSLLVTGHCTTQHSTALTERRASELVLQPGLPYSTLSASQTTTASGRYALELRAPRLSKEMVIPGVLSCESDNDVGCLR